jgi:uncharacterized protein DUF4190
LGSLVEFRGAVRPTNARGTSLAYWSLGSAVVALIALLLLLCSPNPSPASQLDTFLFTYLGLGIAAIVLGHLALSKIKQNRSIDGLRAACSGLWLGYIVVIGPLLAFLGPRPGSHLKEGGFRTKAMSNCRMIITALRLYADDHNGKHPDASLPQAHSSNAVFRQMFVEGQVDSEMIFGCPGSKCGNPDGNIGTAPDYREAVQPGENHWAMTKGLTTASDGSIPLVFENPADATWPPKWSPDLAGTGKPGRTWSGGRVIIGFNDGSVALLPLESSKGEHVGLKPKVDGTPVFPLGDATLTLSVLDAEK